MRDGLSSYVMIRVGNLKAVAAVVDALSCKLSGCGHVENSRKRILLSKMLWLVLWDGLQRSMKFHGFFILLQFCYRTNVVLYRIIDQFRSQLVLACVGGFAIGSEALQSSSWSISLSARVF